ncbi:MAG: ATP-binding protein [Muribaculaceae bacterium]|nr:ATP-binding protein [Muribaculaceae bacterium]
MVIDRPLYIEKLFAKQWNGKVKIITGLRRCGKSFLLSTLYKNRLLANGVAQDQFIEIALDRISGIPYRDPSRLYDYVVEKSKDTSRQFYVFIDEIQLSVKIKNPAIDEALVSEEDRDHVYITFYDVLNDLIARPNLDVYVTGSNSKMLSKDIVTNFRDRGSEIKVYPLSFSEFLTIADLDKVDAFEEYITYGGMPLAVIETNEAEKRRYLADLFTAVYFKDILERYKIKDVEVLGALTDALCSAIGSLTNPNRISNTASTLIDKNISRATIQKYIGYLEDCYLFESAKRWNVKGRKYFDTIHKYYSTDVGLRNARLNFRQQERSHLMENIIYNELIMRGYSVDVGVVEITQTIDGARRQSQYEIDFVVNMGNNKIYIQSALNVDTPDKKAQETMSLRNTNDFYRRLVIVDGNRKAWVDEGITYIGVIPFLLDKSILER